MVFVWRLLQVKMKNDVYIQERTQVVIVLKGCQMISRKKGLEEVEMVVVKGTDWVEWRRIFSFARFFSNHFFTKHYWVGVDIM